MRLLIALALFSSALMAIAAERSVIGPTLSFSVTCRPSEKPWVENYLKLAMRNQAISTAENGDFHLSLVVQPTGVANTSTGYFHSGYAVGYVLTQPLVTNRVIRSFDAIGSHGTAQENFRGNVRLEFLLQGVETCFLGGLQNVCETILKRVDVRALASERRLQDKLREQGFP